MTNPLFLKHMDNTECEKVFNAISEAILEAVDASPYGYVPSGHVYAMLMKYISLDTYMALIALMVQQGKIRVKNHAIYKV